ncbi:hypothetical protein J2X46_002488 [Nocardioides sp. BE266]|uniref:hypothetical protein n=1 Tax=Nocardioides sp. BE266 TaxID=2817725 RepID=UPI002861B268|nr:hypothetical protein [Nocardioides sp. BE266]MDR7253498.1 hypothetical protein [Nocardioides sp. BE266]
MSQPTSYADQRGAVSPVDRVVTVLLLIGLALLVPIAGFMGLLTAMASDGCGVSTCNDTLMTLGVGTSAISPVVVGVGALVWVIVRWVRGLSTWWVPLVAVLLGAGLWALGAVLTFSAVG